MVWSSLFDFFSLIAHARRYVYVGGFVPAMDKIKKEIVMLMLPHRKLYNTSQWMVCESLRPLLTIYPTRNQFKKGIVQKIYNVRTA